MAQAVSGVAACVLLQVDNAYWLWTFQGRLLQKNNKDRFCQLLWRPRPPTLLGQDQIKVGVVPGGQWKCNILVGVWSALGELREHWEASGKEWFQSHKRVFPGHSWPRHCPSGTLA